MQHEAHVPANVASYLENVLNLAEENSVHRDRIDWAAVRRDTHAAAAGAIQTAGAYPAIDAMLMRLGDRHSILVTPEQMRLISDGIARMTGVFATPRGVVARVYPDSPAEQAGIVAGDHIAEIDGVAVDNLDYRQMRVALRAPSVRVLVRERVAGAHHEYTLESKPVPVVTMPSGRLLTDGIGYLDISETLLRDDATVEYATTVHRLIAELEHAGARGWVIDLRLNAGGNMWPMLAGVGPLLGEGKLGSFFAPDWSTEWSYRDGAASLAGDVWTRVPNPYRLARPDPPVAVLTSEITMSSGELTLIAFVGRPRTRVFGNPTYGIPTANWDKVLEDGAMLLLTIALGADRNGMTYDGPIDPDVTIPVDWADLGTERDQVLNAARVWLSDQIRSA